MQSRRGVRCTACPSHQGHHRHGRVPTGAARRSTPGAGRRTMQRAWPGCATPAPSSARRSRRAAYSSPQTANPHRLTHTGRLVERLGRRGGRRDGPIALGTQTAGSITDGVVLRRRRLQADARRLQPRGRHALAPSLDTLASWRAASPTQPWCAASCCGGRRRAARAVAHVRLALCPRVVGSRERRRPGRHGAHRRQAVGDGQGRRRSRAAERLRGARETQNR